MAESEMEILINHARKLPMADILADAFIQMTDRDTWRFYHPPYLNPFIGGDAKTSHGPLLVTLHDSYERYQPTVQLAFYTQSLNTLLADKQDDYLQPAVKIFAGIKAFETSIDPNLRLQYGAEIHFSLTPLYLPSFYSRWILEQIVKITHMMSEKYDPFIDQPTFTQQQFLAWQNSWQN